MEQEDTTARQPQVRNGLVPSSSFCACRLNQVVGICRSRTRVSMLVSGIQIPNLKEQKRHKDAAQV